MENETHPFSVLLAAGQFILTKEPVQPKTTPKATPSTTPFSRKRENYPCGMPGCGMVFHLCYERSEHHAQVHEKALIPCGKSGCLDQFKNYHDLWVHTIRTHMPPPPQQNHDPNR